MIGSVSTGSAAGLNFTYTLNPVSSSFVWDNVFQILFSLHKTNCLSIFIIAMLNLLVLLPQTMKTRNTEFHMADVLSKLIG